MLIRAATLADIPAMIALERAAPSAAHWSTPQYELAIGNPNRVASVLVEDSVIYGFLVARVLDPEWEIENVVIADGRRRQGLGFLLLAELVRLARRESAEAIFLEVRESNLGAVALYEKSGFVRTGCRANYYHQPEENALIYHRFPV